MQIPVGTLRHALSLLEPMVPKSTVLPACQFMLVGEGRAMADDLTVAVTVSLPEAEGPALCFPRASLDFLERVGGQLTATCEVADGNLAIAVGGQRASFKTMPAEDFPPFPHLEPEHEAVMDGDALVRALKAVEPFASTDESRPVLTAVCLDLGEHPHAVAADGFRLAWEELPGKLPGEGQLLIPAEAIRHLARLWKHGGRGAPPPQDTGGLRSLSLVQRLMRLGWKGHHLRLNWGEVTIVLRLIEGSFPNYTTLIPQDFGAHVSFLAEELHRVLGAVGTMARENSGIVRLEWEDNRLQVTVMGQDGEKGEMEVPAIVEGAGRIALNISYLGAYLAQRQGMVKLSVSTPSSPGLLTYHGRGNHVIMPMFVQWATYPPEPAPEADTSGAATAEADLPFGPAHVGETGDPEGPKDDPVFSEETPVEDTEADMTPAPSDQPPTRAEAAKPRRKARKAA